MTYDVSGGTSRAPRVLATVEYYLPGFRSGGPLRSLAGLIDRIGEQFEFSVLTRDHDLHQKTPHPGISRNGWNQVGRAQVFYASSFAVPTLRRVIRESVPDLLYLNSCFSHINIRLLAWRRAGILPRLPVILAPRGELSGGALRLKAAKKRTYLSAALALGLYDDVQWHAASATEAADIRDIIGSGARIHIAPNLPSIDLAAPVAKAPKPAGRARFVSLARVVRMKNLIHALRALREVRGEVELDIFGLMEDRLYWAECQRVIAELPPCIRVTYCGELPHAQVLPTLSQYEFFLSPTLGENFGHAICEALACGCPVVISDRTQFRALTQAGAGWDLSLDDVQPWTAVLQQCVDMAPDAYAAASAAAQRLAAALPGPVAAVQSVAMFHAALGEPRVLAAVASPAPAGEGR